MIRRLPGSARCPRRELRRLPPRHPPGRSPARCRQARPTQLTLVVTGIVLARALGPENRGHLALLVLITALMSALGPLGLPYALSYSLARVSSPRSRRHAPAEAGDRDPARRDNCVRRRPAGRAHLEPPGIRASERVHGAGRGPVGHGSAIRPRRAAGTAAVRGVQRASGRPPQRGLRRGRNRPVPDRRSRVRRRLHMCTA